MSFERYKTQVLLLHSEESTLDALSTGFSDNYSVHCETSGIDALNTLGDTPIHIIVGLTGPCPFASMFSFPPRT